MLEKIFGASWRTTVAGISGALVIILTVVTQLLDGDPATNPDWVVVVPALLAALGLTAARDNKVTSEQAKAGNGATGGGAAIIGFLILCGAGTVHGQTSLQEGSAWYAGTEAEVISHDWPAPIAQPFVPYEVIGNVEGYPTLLPEDVVYETRQLWEPDYTVGLLGIENKPDGSDGIEVIVPLGVGLGIAYSSVTSSNGQDWDITHWSLAVDPIYFERDAYTGALFWQPGLKQSVFNDYLQVFECYRIGHITGPDSFGDRFKVRLGTSLTGIWDGLTGAAGL